MLNTSLNRTPLTRFACIAIVIALVGVTLPIAGFGAQTGPASFSGSLLDMHGRILPNEELLLTNQASGVIHQTRSNDSAQFRFDSLQPGEYELKANVPGFQSRYRITVGAGQALKRDVALQLGSIQETITIRGDGSPSTRTTIRPVVDISNFLNTRSSVRTGTSAAAFSRQPKCATFGRSFRKAAGRPASSSCSRA